MTYDYKLGHKELPEKLLLPDQYKEILSHLISIKIVQEKMLFTIYGSPKELIKLKLKHHIHLPFQKER
jgi:hypothetical protein